MADYTEPDSEQDPVIAREVDRLRQLLSDTDEATFTLRQPKSLDDDDIEVVAVTFTVPTSALLGKMVVHKVAAHSRRDPFFADNEDGEDAFRDGGPEAGGDLPA
jgi:hypothetical protein